VFTFVLSCLSFSQRTFSPSTIHILWPKVFKVYAIIEFYFSLAYHIQEDYLNLEQQDILDIIKE